MSKPHSKNGDPTDKSKPLIFAVDDEPMLLELISLVLEPLGYRVRTFRDPTTAVRALALAKPPPALVITDYAMHNMTGMDLIREVRRINPKQKILMVSGTVDETIFRDAPEKPNKFLAKPYPAKQLAEMVKALVGSLTPAGGGKNNSPGNASRW